MNGASGLPPRTVGRPEPMARCVEVALPTGAGPSGAKTHLVTVPEVVLGAARADRLIATGRPVTGRGGPTTARVRPSGATIVLEAVGAEYPRSVGEPG